MAKLGSTTSPLRLSMPLLYLVVTVGAIRLFFFVHSARIPFPYATYALESNEPQYGTAKRFWPEGTNSLRAQYLPQIFRPHYFAWADENLQPDWKSLLTRNTQALTVDESQFLTNLLLASAMSRAQRKQDLPSTAGNVNPALQSGWKREARNKLSKSRCQVNLGMSNGCTFQEAIEGDMFKKYLTSIDGPG